MRNLSRGIKAAKSEIKGYLKSARLLLIVTETDTDVIRTSIMVLSFGVEKSLKALRRYVDREPPLRRHNLADLYNALSNQTRAELVILAGAKHRDVLWALSGNRNSFEEWRYAEEAQGNLEFTRPGVMISIMESALFRLGVELDRILESEG